MPILPPPLNKGDTVTVVAPSRKIFEAQVAAAWDVFEEWGLEVIKAPNLFSEDGYFAGTDTLRMTDFQSALDDLKIRAVFCARGGYGATRFVDKLKWPAETSPKWIIGFSDVTAVHLAAARAGWATVHGLMPAQYGYDNVTRSLDSLRDLLFYHSFSHTLEADPRLHNPGSVTAPIVGGNLSLIAESLATPAEIDTRGKILLIEEIDEYLYKIDRMLNQLERAGKLSELKGVLVGDFSDMKDTEIPFGRDIFGLLHRYFGERNIPVAAGVPVGHERLNLAIPLMTPVSLEVGSDQYRISLAHPS